MYRELIGFQREVEWPRWDCEARRSSSVMPEGEGGFLRRETGL